MWKWGAVGGDYLMRGVRHVMENRFCWSIKEMGGHLGRPGGKRAILELLVLLLLLRNLLTTSTDSMCGHVPFSAGFPSLGIIDIWGVMMLCCWGLSHALQDFSSILGFYLLDAHSTPLPRCETTNVSRHCQRPLGGNITSSSEPLVLAVPYLIIFSNYWTILKIKEYYFKSWFLVSLWKVQMSWWHGVLPVLFPSWPLVPL